MSFDPFTDGNGRTGRIINILYLVLKGLLELPAGKENLYLNAKLYRLLSAE